MKRFFEESRFEICLLKALGWHGLIAIAAAVVFAAFKYVFVTLDVVEEMAAFSIGDQAIVMTFGVITSVSAVLRCLIIEIVALINRRW